jgi:hypothetical protein
MTDLTDLTVTTLTATTVTAALVGTSLGAHTGLHYDAAAPTAYATGSAQAIDPAIAAASLTKTTPAGTYTLAAPGSANVNKKIFVYTTVALAHVITITGLLGGNTLTLTAAIGSSFMLYAVSATAWAVVSLNGATQTNA